MKNNIYLNSILCLLMSCWFALGHLQAQITCSAPGSSANIILSEDFSANAPFGWTQDAGDDFDWVVTQTGPTTTGNTGPDAAHSGPHYAYIETSLTFNGDTANLISPAVDLLRCSNTDAELSFYYHMFGGGTNLLEVDISSGSPLGPWVNAPITPAPLTGQQQTAGSDPWRLARVDLSTFIGSIIYIRFQGVAGPGFEGDIAIDLVQVEGCSPCETPQGFHAFNVLDTQTDLFWTHPAGTCTNTIVEYGPLGFTPGGGTSVTLPCPVTVPYTLTGLTAGTTYDIYVRHQCGASFSCNSGTSVTTFATCSQSPAPSAGTITANMVSPPANPYFLCFEDTIRMNSAGFVPPSLPAGVDPTGLGFALYTCAPTSTNPNPNTDSCYTGYWFVTDDFFTVNNATNVYDAIIAAPAAVAGPNGVPTNRTLYFVPTTMDDAVAGGSNFGYDLNGDNCGDRGAPVEVVFLEQITFTSSTITCTPPNTLNNPIVITIAGGLPGFNPGTNYTATNVGDGTMTVSGAQNETLTFTGLAVGDQIQVDIMDGQGCLATYDSGVIACPGGPIVQIDGCGPNLQTDACAGSCITLNTLVRGGAIGSPPITTLNSAPAGVANGQNGIMFDLEATTDIIVNTLGIDLDVAPAVNVNIYLKCGTLAGSESTPGDWQLAGSAAFAAIQGINTIPIDINLAMCAGSRYAVYIQTDGQVNYQTGSNQLGAVITSDANLNIYGGLGVELSFGTLYGNAPATPTEGRLFLGDINYSTTGFAYSWDNGATGDACAICPVANGLHTLTVTGSTGAVTTETFNVTNIISEAADDGFHMAEGTQSDGAASSCLNPASAAGAYVVNTICSGSTGSTLRPGSSSGGGGPAPWAVTCTGGPIPLNDNPVFMTIQCAGNGTMTLDVTNPGGGAVSNIYGALVGPITCPNTIADLGTATAVDCDQNAASFTLTAPSVIAGQLYALIINTTGQGNVNINVAGTAFPIELANLKATRVGQTSLVSWTTLSETQNDRFEIERSTDGIDFTYIGSVKGSGSTTLSNDYEFVDRTPKEGVNFYRLNQIDIDGTSHHSNVVSVEFSVDNFNVEVYPNPFSEVLNFSIMATDATPATILLYDLAGKQVWNHSCELEAGGNLLELETNESTPAGTYLLVVKYQGKAKTFKVFKE